MLLHVTSVSVCVFIPCVSAGRDPPEVMNGLHLLNCNGTWSSLPGGRLGAELVVGWKLRGWKEMTDCQIDTMGIASTGLLRPSVEPRPLDVILSSKAELFLFCLSVTLYFPSHSLIPQCVAELLPLTCSVAVRLVAHDRKQSSCLGCMGVTAICNGFSRRSRRCFAASQATGSPHSCQAGMFLVSSVVRKNAGSTQIPDEVWVWWKNVYRTCTCSHLITG